MPTVNPPEGAAPKPTGDGLYVPVTLTVEELWYLQSIVRHEIVAEGMWQIPPASRYFSDQVAWGIWFCHRNGIMEACLNVSLHEVYIVDFCASQLARNTKGDPVGMSVIWKIAVDARMKLMGTGLPDATEPPDQPTAHQVAAMLRHATGKDQ